MRQFQFVVFLLIFLIQKGDGNHDFIEHRANAIVLVELLLVVFQPKVLPVWIKIVLAVFEVFLDQFIREIKRWSVVYIFN